MSREIHTICYPKNSSYVSKQNVETNEKPIMVLNKQTFLSQEWHDQRYWKARKAGVSHSSAWRQEKNRRRATLHRKSGITKRALERQELEIQWFEQHRNRTRTMKDYVPADTENVVSNVETEGPTTRSLGNLGSPWLSTTYPIGMILHQNPQHPRSPPVVFPCVLVGFCPGEDCAGCDATLPKISVEQQQRLLMFFHPEPQMPSEAMAEILRLKKNNKIRG